MTTEATPPESPQQLDSTSCTVAIITVLLTGGLFLYAWSSCTESEPEREARLERESEHRKKIEKDLTELQLYEDNMYQWRGLFVGTSMPAVKRMIVLTRAGDHLGVSKLEDSGLLIRPDRKTRVRLLQADPESGIAEVQVLEGVYRDRYVWVESKSLYRPR